MLIAQSMVAGSLAVERLRSEFEARADEIENFIGSGSNFCGSKQRICESGYDSSLDADYQLYDGSRYRSFARDDERSDSCRRFSVIGGQISIINFSSVLLRQRL